MSFTGSLRLNEKNVKKNLEERTQFKNLLNSLFGKFSQKNYPYSCFVSEKSVLDEYFSTGNIVDVTPINSKIMQVQMQHQTDRAKIDLKSNCVIGAFITSFSRVDMNINIQKLAKHGHSLFYMDCDNLVYSSQIGNPNPLKIGPCFGEFKDEFEGEEILEYFALGKKNHTFTLKSQEGVVRTVSKIRGLSMSAVMPKKAFSPDTYSSFLKSYLLRHKRSIYVPQHRTKKGKSHIQDFSFSNDVSPQRVILNDSPILKTVPFGYVK